MLFRSVPWALLALFLASVALADRSWGYTGALVLQVLFYGLAAAGGCLDRERPRDAAATEPRTTGRDGRDLALAKETR